MSNGAAIAKVIATHGSKDFAEAITQLIERAARSDSTIAMLNCADVPPQILCDRQSALEKPIFYSDYMSGVYLLSPVYQAAIATRTPRLVRLSEIAPDGFRYSDYYDKYFRQIGIGDLVALLIPAPDGKVWHISAGRSEGKPRFSRKDLAELHDLMVICAAAITRHCAADQPVQSPPPSKALRPQDVMDLLKQDQASPLTGREGDVVMAMLSGHSSKSMARLLGISPETVRVHRKHVYEKLSVSGQSELFSLFLTRLGILADG